MKACPACCGKHFTAPPGEPDMAGPCMKCNADWKLRPAEGYPSPGEPFPFGKHAGVPYGELLRDNRGYLRWLAVQPWISSWKRVQAYLEAHEDDINR